MSILDLFFGCTCKVSNLVPTDRNNIVSPTIIPNCVKDHSGAIAVRGDYPVKGGGIVDHVGGRKVDHLA